MRFRSRIALLLLLTNAATAAIVYYTRGTKEVPRSITTDKVAIHYDRDMIIIVNKTGLDLYMCSMRFKVITAASSYQGLHTQDQWLNNKEIVIQHPSKALADSSPECALDANAFNQDGQIVFIKVP